MMDPQPSAGFLFCCGRKNKQRWGRGDPAAARTTASGQRPVGLPGTSPAALHPVGAGAEGRGAHSLGDVGPESSGLLPQTPAEIFGKVLLSPRSVCFQRLLLSSERRPRSGSTQEESGGGAVGAGTALTLASPPPQAASPRSP